MNENLCPKCQFPQAPEFNFCPRCGKQIKEIPPPVTFMSQLKVYTISVFLPPLGLWPAVKYLRQKDQTSKVIGLIALLLTIASTVITVQYTMTLSNKLNSTINQQMMQYQNMSR